MGFAYRVGLTLVASSVALGVGSCSGATEILLDFHTNVPCAGAAPWHGIAVYTGHTRVSTSRPGSGR